MHSFLDSLDLINLDFIDDKELEKIKLIIEHMVMNTTIDFNTKVSFDEIRVRRKPKVVVVNSKVTINKINKK